MRSFVRWATAACCIVSAASCQRSSRDRRDARAAVEGAAGPAHLVADVRTGSAPHGSSPHGFVVSGSTAYFAADDGSSGYELWKTGWTVGGTSLVLDIRPGGASALPDPDGHVEAVAFGEGILFAADDGVHGMELWFSDGTAAGTRLVKDVEPGSAAATPRSLTAVGSTVFFVADTSANGAEVWRTDGTESGTTLVHEIGPGEMASNPTGLLAMGSTLFFVATDPVYGTGLWKTDGTSTSRVTAAFGAGVFSPASLTVFQGKLLFAASSTEGGASQLWSSDGISGATTKPLVNPRGATSPALLTPFGTKLFYAAAVNAKRELFSTDGYTQSQLTDADSGAGGATDPVAMAAAGGHLFVSATNPASGRELFVWTGSALQLLVDAAAGGAGSDPGPLADVGGMLLFAAKDGETRSLYRSNGTAAGTVRVFDFGGPDVVDVVPFGDGFGGGALVTARDEASGLELWRSDGTEDGTVLLANLREDNATSQPQSLTAIGGRLYFSADTGTDDLATGRETWMSDPQAGTAALAADVFIGTPSSFPDDFLDLAGTILFTAYDPNVGREVWRLDETEGWADPVRDIRAGGSSVQRPAYLTPLGTAALFAAHDGSTGRELWRTDGTSGGTFLVKDLCDGCDSSPSGLAVAGPNVWFAANDGTDVKPYLSDGTAAGTLSAGDLYCDSSNPVTDPAWFAELSGTALFSAANYDLGRELFRFNPALGPHGCTTLVKDIVSGPDGSDPVAFAVRQGVGYFGARYFDDALGRMKGYALWRTDGFSPGTTRLASVGTFGGGSISSTVSLDCVPAPDRPGCGLLFFIGNDEVHGHELWKSDGTPVGTRRVADADATPGPVVSAEASAILPLPWRGYVLFAGDDGALGRELWISNGTRLGTRLLQDVRAGMKSSNPADFTTVGEYVYFTADDGASGRELWMLDTSEGALDLTPPSVQCPVAPVVFEATRAGFADPVFALSVTDAGGPVTPTYAPASGSAIPVGLTPVTATAVDASGNVAECSFSVVVRDTTPPALTCPTSMSVEASRGDGADASYAATAVDVGSPPALVQYAPASGSAFALGAGKTPRTTPVTVTASDGADPVNVSSCSFSVTVADTLPPVVTCPSVPELEATQDEGAIATWPDPTVWDTVSAADAISIEYSAARATMFVIGVTTVTATARDEAGNSAHCSFPIRVRDGVAPVVTCPTLDPIEATTFGGAAVSFTATATDAVTPSPPVTYSQAPGSLFFLGTTDVRASATDASGNTGECTIHVTVQDTTVPDLRCPQTVAVGEAADALGGAVWFAATATDVASAHPLVSYSTSLGATAPGSRFPLDTTKVVTATATDDRGNISTCTFDVTVLDRTGPALVGCPFVENHEATGPAGALVVHSRAFAHDAVTPDPDLVFSFSQPDGTLQAIGSANVEGFATDARGNTSAACAFVSRVRDTTPPALTCPADITVEAIDAAGADASFVAEAVDLVSGSVTPTYLPWSGFTFGIGSAKARATRVLVTASDGADPANVSTCAFTVTVVDTTPPSFISCPDPDPIEAGSAARFAAVATDTVSAVVVSYSAEDSVFPVGTTFVTAFAMDAAENVATCAFAVAVEDTTPPTIVCPPDRSATTTASGASVTFPAPSTTDVGTPTPAVTSSAQSGDVFPVGTTDVTFTATDGSGNFAQCTMRVTVTKVSSGGGGGGGGGGGCGTGSAGASALLGLLAAVVLRRRR